MWGVGVVGFVVVVVVVVGGCRAYGGLRIQDDTLRGGVDGVVVRLKTLTAFSGHHAPHALSNSVMSSIVVNIGEDKAPVRLEFGPVCPAGTSDPERIEWTMDKEVGSAGPGCRAVKM